MSLRLKTIIGITVIQAILLAILVYSGLNYLRTTSQDNLKTYANTTINLFATSAKNALLSYDLASLQSFTAEILKNEEVVYVRIRDNHNNTLAEGGNTIFLGLPFKEDSSLQSVNDSIYDIGTYIAEADKVYGYIEMGISTAKATAAFKTASNMSASIAIGEMALVVLLSYLLGTYLTLQLRHLNKAALKIADGDYQYKIPVKGRDELSVLARSFNTMSENLSQSDTARKEFESAIKKINVQLDLRVKKRTSELTEKNDELSNAYGELKTAQTQLMQAEKMASVGQLAAGVAHEINNPVGFINSNLTTLEHYIGTYQQFIQKQAEFIATIEPQANEEQKVMIDNIRDFYGKEDILFIENDINELLHDSLDGAERISDIVKNLKDYSRIDQEEMQEADINKCLETTLKIVNNNIRYKCKVKKDLQAVPLVKCNPGKLNQVFTNLIVNAGQAIKDKGEISIQTKSADEKVFIFISDNGCGIPKNHLSKLFDPFFTTKTIGEGTGLGLSITQGIIKDHGGTITVDSEIDEGTTFSITLPIVNTANTANNISL